MIQLLQSMILYEAASMHAIEIVLPPAFVPHSDNNTTERSRSFTFWSAQTHGAAAEDLCWISDSKKRELEDILKTLINTSGDFVFVIFSTIDTTICPVNFQQNRSSG